MDEKLMGDLDKDFIEDVKKFTEDGDLLNSIAQIFKTLSDPTRLKQQD